MSSPGKRDEEPKEHASSAETPPTEPPKAPATEAPADDGSPPKAGPKARMPILGGFFSSSSPASDQVQAQNAPSLTERWTGWVSGKIFRSRLPRLLALEEAQWRSQSDRAKGLLMALQVRYEGARVAAERDALLGFILSGIGLIGVAVAVFIAFEGWNSIRTHVLSNLTPSSQATWQVLLSTSGAVLLTLGCSTVLLNGANRFWDRSRHLMGDANRCKRMEVGIWLLSGALSDDEQVVERINAAGMKLIEEPLAEEKPSSDVSIVNVKDVKDTMEVARGFIKDTGGVVADAIKASKS